MPGPAREWVTFDDSKEEGRRWQVDVTFLLSSWQCIFGNGCQGVMDDPAPELVHGCCSHGAYFSDKKDRDHVVKLAKKLDESVWQLAKIGRKKGIYAKVGKDDEGTTEYRTRLVDGACIFLNRPGFTTGPGCALHVHAMNTGVHFSETKPEVCWQLPLRRIDEEQDDGTVISKLTEFARDGWGEGGTDFAWWCTEAPEAFTGAKPVYEEMAEELRHMLGNSLYTEVAAYLDQRRAAQPPPVLHPAQQPVTIRTSR